VQEGPEGDEEEALPEEVVVSSDTHFLGELAGSPRRRPAGRQGGQSEREGEAEAAGQEEVTSVAVLVAAISDTHLPRGARRLPEACLERLRTADLILHGGDLCALAVLEKLRALGPPVQAVYGNRDEPAVRELLPKELVVEAGGARFGMVHIAGPAAGRDERLVRLFPGCDAVLYGHTHLPQVERRGDVWILNPGSPTERRRGPFHSMLLLEVNAGAISPELVRLT
jgi:putative phosphoesterase